MELSEGQRTAALDYLSQHPRTCDECDQNDWELGDIQLTAAEVYTEPREVEPGSEYIEITCQSCGHTDAIDCVEAGIPEN
jgi:predicted nucleic-acid-binding Zn-ribbon protein